MHPALFVFSSKGNCIFMAEFSCRCKTEYGVSQNSSLPGYQGYVEDSCGLGCSFLRIIRWAYVEKPLLHFRPMVNQWPAVALSVQIS